MTESVDMEKKKSEFGSCNQSRAVDRTGWQRQRWVMARRPRALHVAASLLKQQENSVRENTGAARLNFNIQLLNSLLAFSG